MHETTPIYTEHFALWLGTTLLFHSVKDAFKLWFKPDSEALWGELSPESKSRLSIPGLIRSYIVDFAITAFSFINYFFKF